MLEPELLVDTLGEEDLEQRLIRDVTLVGEHLQVVE
jgi:hypothetical protein